MMNLVQSKQKRLVGQELVRKPTGDRAEMKELLYGDSGRRITILLALFYMNTAT